MGLTETHFQTNWTSLESHQITAVIRHTRERNLYEVGSHSSEKLSNY